MAGAALPDATIERAICVLLGLRGDLPAIADRFDAVLELLAQAHQEHVKLYASALKDARTAIACESLLAALGAERPATLSAAVERAAGRVRLLRRFGELRAAEPNASDLRLLKRVNAEADRIAPGARCSVLGAVASALAQGLEHRRP